MNENHLKAIKNILSEKFGVAEDQILPESHLTEDFNLGKIEIIDLIEMLTSKLSVSLPDDLVVENLNTVSDLLILLEQQSLEI